MARGFWSLLVMVMALGCGARTGLLSDGDVPPGDGGIVDAGTWQPMRWVLTDSVYRVFDGSTVGLVELTASGELHYEQKVVLGLYERVVGVDADHVFVDSRVDDREPQRLFRILSTRDLSDLAELELPGGVDCVVSRGRERAVAFGDGIYLVNPSSATLIREVDMSDVPDFRQCWACTDNGEVAATIGDFESTLPPFDHHSALLLFDLHSETLMDAGSESPGTDPFPMEVGRTIIRGFSYSRRLLTQGHSLYMIKLSTTEEQHVERFDLQRLVSDGVVFSWRRDADFLNPEPVILTDGRWLTGIENDFVRLDPADWTLEIVPGVWADQLGGLAMAGDGLFVHVGRVEYGGAEMSIAVRDVTTGALLADAPFPGHSDVGTFLDLWPIPALESGGP